MNEWTSELIGVWATCITLLFNRGSRLIRSCLIKIWVGVSTGLGRGLRRLGLQIHRLHVPCCSSCRELRWCLFVRLKNLMLRWYRVEAWDSWLGLKVTKVKAGRLDIAYWQGWGFELWLGLSHHIGRLLEERRLRTCISEHWVSTWRLML